MAKTKAPLAAANCHFVGERVSGKEREESSSRPNWSKFTVGAEKAARERMHSH